MTTEDGNRGSSVVTSCPLAGFRLPLGPLLHSTGKPRRFFEFSFVFSSKIKADESKNKKHTHGRRKPE